MKQFKSEITSNIQLCDEYYQISFTWPEDMPPPGAGQFFTIRVNNGLTPLLRKPFAFSAFKNNQAEMIYQIRGTGTKLLAEKKAGSKVDILAPLGNTFSEPEKGKHPVLIAGGIGTGPIFYFAEYLQSKGYNPLVVAGYRTQSLVPEKAVPQDIKTIICTDDGSMGFKGNTIQYVKTLDNLENTLLYACGPNVMLKAASDLAEEYDIPCEVSMEEYMACGIGACMGCVVKVKTDKQFLRVCKDGPVFDGRIIEWT